MYDDYIIVEEHRRLLLLGIVHVINASTSAVAKL